MTDEEYRVIVVSLLAEIRDGVNALNATVEVEATDECPHPEDRRVDISTLSDQNHWICADCKFDSKQALTKN